MASTAAVQLCSTCNDSVGSFHCAGCKEIFCLKHCNEHRRELEDELNQLKTELDTISQQVQEVPDTQSLKERLYDQIDDWKDRTIENVSQKAEELRRRADELLDSKDVKMREIQHLTNELKTRKEKQDFFEDDLQRIEENIRDFRRSLDQTMHQPNLELCTEEIDWENLISIKNNVSVTSSSPTNKPNGRSDSHGKRHSSPLWRPPIVVYYLMLLSLSYFSIF